jgi:hypothetical protein
MIDAKAELLLAAAIKDVTFTLKDTQARYGHGIQKAFALVKEEVDLDLSAVTHGSAADNVATKMKSAVQGVSAHRQVVALVQVSGGGKSKVSLDLCLQKHFWPVYVPLRSIPGSARKPDALQYLLDQLSCLRPKSEQSYNDAEKADRNRLDYVEAFVAVHVRIVCAMINILLRDARFERLEDVNKRVLFVYGQCGMASTFSSHAKDVFKNDEIRAHISNANQEAKNCNLCIVYDEVMSVSNLLVGHFLHQRSVHVKDEQEYLDAQKMEMKMQPPKKPFTAPTDLLYALRRVMNTLTDNGIPQVTMDTNFTSAEEVFHREGSATRELITFVSDLPGVTQADIVVWFTKVFGDKCKDCVSEMADFEGRPRIFYESFLKKALFPTMRRHPPADVQSVAQLVKDCIPIARDESNDWMGSFIATKGDSKSGTSASLICSCFVQAWWKDGSFSAPSSTLQRLLSDGLIFKSFARPGNVNPNDDNANFKREPLLWTAMLDFYERKSEWVLNEILSKAHQGNARQEIGKEMELALGWKLYCARGKKFSSVFPTVFPVAPPWVHEGTIRVAEVRGEPSQRDFFQLLSDKPDAMIFPADMCGPDIVFTIETPKTGERVRVYVQVKNKRSGTSFAEALYSIEPCLLYKSNRSYIVANRDTHGIVPCEDMTSTFSSNADLRESYVRLILSLSLSKGVKDWMSPEPGRKDLQELSSRFPVLIAQTSDTALVDSEVLQKYYSDTKKLASLHKPTAKKGYPPPDVPFLLTRSLPRLGPGPHAADSRLCASANLSAAQLAMTSISSGAASATPSSSASPLCDSASAAQSAVALTHLGSKQDTTVKAHKATGSTAAKERKPKESGGGNTRLPSKLPKRVPKWQQPISKYMSDQHCSE